jgi:hypothetical protein
MNDEYLYIEVKPMLADALRQQGICHADCPRRGPWGDFLRWPRIFVYKVASAGQRREVARGEAKARPASLGDIEECATSLHWSREPQALRHVVA